MIFINYKKDAISFLNEIFGNYNQMHDICGLCDNDIVTIIQIISKIIKYVFINYNSLSGKFYIRHFIGKLPNIDVEFALLCHTKGGKSLLKKSGIIPPYPLDADIDLTDLIGINLPDLEFIEEICLENKQYDEVISLKSRERQEKLSALMGFEPTAFTYVTEDIVYLDDTFNYDGLQLTGDIIADFRTLYNDETYQNSDILNRKYSDNLRAILNAHDIALVKKGSLYFINNGRHRIFYLLARGGNVAIRALVSKRIENERLNNILLRLQEEIDFKVFKDNPYSEDEVICLIYKGNLYKISNLTELEVFAASYDKYPYTMPYIIKQLTEEELRKCIGIITNYCAQNHINILEVSFSDLMANIGILPDSNLYEAYITLAALKKQEQIDKQLKELDKKYLNR